MFTANVRSLKHLCRLRIRERLRSLRLKSPVFLTYLPLPNSLKDYLRFKEYDLYGRGSVTEERWLVMNIFADSKCPVTLLLDTMQKCYAHALFASWTINAWCYFCYDQLIFLLNWNGGWVEARSGTMGGWLKSSLHQNENFCSGIFRWQ